MIRRTLAALAAAALLTLTGACGPTGGSTPPGAGVPGTTTYDFYFVLKDSFGNFVLSTVDEPYEITATISGVADDGTPVEIVSEDGQSVTALTLVKAFGSTEAEPWFHYAAHLTPEVVGATVVVELFPPIASPGDTMECWVTGPSGAIVDSNTAAVPADSGEFLNPLTVTCVAP